MSENSSPPHLAGHWQISPSYLLFLFDSVSLVFARVRVAWKGVGPCGPEGACKATAKAAKPEVDGMHDRFALFIGM